MILFLDFDGVLHPEPCHDSPHFVRMPLLERALAQLPQVHVVVSSSWRHGRTLEELCAPFPEALRPRVIGITPTMKDIADRVPEELKRFPREAECLDWLRTNAPRSSWLALDDCPWLFTPLCRNLFEVDCETGLQERDVSEMVRLARSLAGG